MKISKMLCSLVVTCSLIGCATQTESSVINTSSRTETSWQYDGGETTIPSKKEETVNVQADASGTPLKTTIHTKLSQIDTTKVIEDSSNVIEISNTNGEEQFEQKDGKIYWQNLGNDISYTATSNTNLPVTVKIHYYLDGQEVSASEIAGKSGHIKIHFEYINQTSYEEVHVPFTCVSIVMLDSNHFSNITVDHGKVSEADETSIVFGYAMPCLKQDLNLSCYEDIDLNLPESVEIEADTDAFTLDFTETLISNGMFNEIEDADLDDLEEVSDNFMDLGEAGDSLTSGGTELKDVYSKVQEGINAYLDGIEQLTDGFKQLSDASQTINENTITLVNATKGLSDAFGSIDTDALSESVITEIQTDMSTLQTLASSLQTISDGLINLETTLNTILETKELTEEEKQKIQEQFDSMSQTICSVQEQFNTCLFGLEKKINSIDIDGIKTTFQQLKETTNQIAQGTNALSNGINGLNGGITQVQTLLNTATQNNVKIKDAMSQLSTGFTAFQKGIESLNTDGLQKLKEKGGVEFGNLLERISLLKQADASYSSYTGLSNGQVGSVTFMIETVKVSKD